MTDRYRFTEPGQYVDGTTGDESASLALKNLLSTVDSDKARELLRERHIYETEEQLDEWDLEAAEELPFHTAPGLVWQWHEGNLILYPESEVLAPDEYLEAIYYEERGESSLRLQSIATEEDVLAWNNEELRQAVEDGFLNPKNWKTSAIECAKAQGLLS